MTAEKSPAKPARKPGRPRTFVLGNGPLFDGKGGVFVNGALRVEGDRVAAVGDCDAIKKESIPFIDVQGNLILPGLINLHHHFYSALAAGFPSRGPVIDFRSNLENFWWPLDRALDREAVEASALLSLVESMKHGVTTVFDHHSSPTCQEGILDVIAACAGQAGISALLSLEVSDRNGPEARNAGIAENIRFISRQRGHPSVRGLMGLHANFTLSRETLEKTAAALPNGAAVHIHCGEAACDAAFCLDEGFRGPADRLAAFGLLDGGAVLAHGVHLAEEEFGMIESAGAHVVHNPESNSKNAVGDLSPTAAGFGLGTDGMTSSMLATLRFAFLKRRALKGDPGYGPGEVLDALFGVNSAVASAVLGDTVGVLEPGARADVAVMDYCPLSDVGAANIAGHLLFGAHASRALWVFASGAALLWNGRPITLNESEIRERGTAQARRLLARYTQLPG